MDPSVETVVQPLKRAASDLFCYPGRGAIQIAGRGTLAAGGGVISSRRARLESTKKLAAARDPSVKRLATAAPCQDQRGIKIAFRHRLRVAAPNWVAVRF